MRSIDIDGVAFCDVNRSAHFAETVKVRKFLVQSVCPIATYPVRAFVTVQPECMHLNRKLSHKAVTTRFVKRYTSSG